MMTTIEHQHLPIVSNDNFQQQQQQQLPSLKRNYEENDKLKNHSGNNSISQPPSETKLDDDTNDSSSSTVVPLAKKPKITLEGQMSQHEGVPNRPTELPQEVSPNSKDDSVVKEDRPIIAPKGQNDERVVSNHLPDPMAAAAAIQVSALSLPLPLPLPLSTVGAPVASTQQQDDSSDSIVLPMTKQRSPKTIKVTVMDGETNDYFAVNLLAELPKEDLLSRPSILFPAKDTLPPPPDVTTDYDGSDWIGQGGSTTTNPKIAEEGSVELPQEALSNTKHSVLKEDRAKLASERQNDERVVSNHRLPDPMAAAAIQVSALPLSTVGAPVASTQQQDDSSDSIVLPMTKQRSPKRIKVTVMDGETNDYFAVNLLAELPAQEDLLARPSILFPTKDTLPPPSDVTTDYYGSDWIEQGGSTTTNPKIAEEGSVELPQEALSNTKYSVLKEDRAKLVSEGQIDERVVSNLPVDAPQDVSSNKKHSVLKEDRAKLVPEGQNDERVVSNLPVLELPQQEALSNDNHHFEQEDKAKRASEGQNDERISNLPVLELPQEALSNTKHSLLKEDRAKLTSEGQIDERVVSNHLPVLDLPKQEALSNTKHSVLKEDRAKLVPEGQNDERVSNVPVLDLPKQEALSNTKHSVLKEDKAKLVSEGQNSERVLNLQVELPHEESLSNTKHSVLEEDRKLAPEGQNDEGVASRPVDLPQDVSFNNNHLSEKEKSSDLQKDHHSNKENSTIKGSKNGGRKAVEKLCLNTGEVIGTFQSVTEAAKSVDVSIAAVRHALTGWKGRKSSAGFGWRYALPDAVLPDSAISAGLSTTERLADTTQASRKPRVRQIRAKNQELNVEQVCLATGKVLQRLDSWKELSKLTGLKRKEVQKAIGNVYQGFFWRAAGSIDLPPHTPPPASMPLPTNQITTDAASRPRKPASAGSQLKTTSASLKSPPDTRTPIDTFFKPVQTSANSRHKKKPKPRATSQKLVDQESLTRESISPQRADSTKDAEVFSRTMSHILPLSMPLSTDHTTTIDTSHPKMPASTGFLKLNTTPVSSKSPANPQTPIDTDKTVQTPANSRSLEKPDRFQVGDVVLCNHQTGNKAEKQRQKGRVAIVHKTGRCDVVFEDGKCRRNIPKKRCRLIERGRDEKGWVVGLTIKLQEHRRFGKIAPARIVRIEDGDRVVLMFPNWLEINRSYEQVAATLMIGALGKAKKATKKNVSTASKPVRPKPNPPKKLEPLVELSPPVVVTSEPEPPATAKLPKKKAKKKPETPPLLVAEVHVAPPKKPRVELSSPAVVTSKPEPPATAKPPKKRATNPPQEEPPKKLKPLVELSPPSVVTRKPEPPATAKPPKKRATKLSLPVVVTRSKPEPRMKRAKKKPEAPPLVAAKLPVAPPKKTTEGHFGCRHCGVMDLSAMEPKTVSYYLRPQEYLHDFACLDCTVKVAMLPRGLLYYCDEGVKSFHAEDTDPLKEELKCDMVLCSACYLVRTEKYNGASGGRRGARRLR